jgi:ferredoxin
MKETETTQLHKLVAEAMPRLDTMIGWTAGHDPLRSAPVFIRNAESIHRLIWSPFCAQNLTGYLVKPPAVKPADKDRKIGICVRGCDSRSLVSLIQEKLVTRDSLYIIGIPCRGAVDWRRVAARVELSGLRSARVEGDTLVVECADGSHETRLKDVLARKCLRCRHPNPVIHDVLVGEPVTPRVMEQDRYRDVEALEEKSIEERLAFWQAELDRCMSCYACRNACPLCVCQDHCIVEARDPKWLTQRMDLSEKFLFHFIHALHLAGRCTECGECERACPMEIPVALMKEKLNKIMKEMLSYEAGLDPDGVPPLLTFNPSETGI